MAPDFSTTRMHNKHFIKLFTSGHEVAKQMKMKLIGLNFEFWQI